MKIAKRSITALLIGTLLVSGFLLLTEEPASAKTHFSFGLHLGIPLTPYPAYTHPYPYRPPVRYAPAPYYQVYPPCARVWVPGYYDGYGNWIFGYYQYDCGYYGYEGW